MAVRPVLHVWLYGRHLGILRAPSFGKLRFEPDPSVLDRWPLGSTVLSVALPFNGRVPNGVAVRAFFDGLLPEGEARTALERAFGLARGDAFSLLRELGRDCAGAVVLTPDPGEVPGDDTEVPGEVRPLSEAELVEAVAGLQDRPLGASAEVRVSLAGQQAKLLLCRLDDGTFGRPVGGTPTDVLLKPEPASFPGYVGNEAFCMRLAHAVGLTTVVVDTIEVGGRAVLVVPRYDRTVDDRGRRRRVHQEDCCQALAVDCSMQDRKYERDGGPSLAKVAAVLDRHGQPGDRRRLLAATTFNVAMGNADAHGKNLSLLHHADGSAELAPLYDVSCTVRYEAVETPTGRRRLSTELGMTVNGVTSVDRVLASDLVGEAVRWGLPSGDAERVVESTLHAVRSGVHRLATEVGHIDDEVVQVVGERTDSLLAGVPAGAYTPRDLHPGADRAAVRAELRTQGGPA
jgi:serine/threonine-protein kinase HipA